MKYIFIGLIILSFCSCAEDNLLDVDNSTVKSNAISFNVTTGITSNVNTRARLSDNSDSLNLLQPLVLTSAELGNPLYLHTYVAEEGESSANEITTRAAQVNNLNDFVTLNKAGFNLEAYDDDDNEFIPRYATAKPQSNDASEAVWNTSPLYYWPVDNRLLSFYAFAPKSAQSLLENIKLDNTNKTISFDYEVPNGTVSEGDENDAEVQPDIMLAITECNKTTSADGKVPMNFRHALSAIKFAIRDVVGGTIEQISIIGVSGKAHCVYTKTETVDNFVWSEHGQAENEYTQTFNYKTTDKTSEDDVVLNTQMPSKTFMMIPQEIPADAKIEVVFKRDYDSQTFTMSGNIRDNQVTKWEPGKEYIYTISTSSSNWIYYFEVLGSEQQKNDDEPTKGSFKDSDRIILNQTVTKGAYYKVKSYRVRANNLNQIEPVAWKVNKISDGVTTKPDNDNFNFDIATPVVPHDIWIPIKTMSGTGSAESTKYDLEFYPQITGTDYSGDWDLKNRAEIGTASSPFDLSEINGKMSTANCYVVNAPGYFKLPLVYGNAIKNGQTNSSSYTYTDPGNYDKKSSYPSLTNFIDYKGNAIITPEINGGKDAILVWEDAYNLISDVKLNASDGTYGSISFKVNKENLQQGNAVIAVRDANQDIIWSWHIWITEHWAKKGTLELTNDVVALPTYDSGMVDGNIFYVAPRNLGWCDPKNIWYLKRTGNIEFVQEKSGKTANLPIEQREKMIEYWIGNNTYYQFGRKDPMVGFMNSSHVVKYNFGTYPYGLLNQPVDIESGIKQPNILFVGAAPNVDNNDWISTHYQNLWNNANNFTTTSPTSDNKIKYHYSGVKTVYDPCPVGYMVPPVGFFKYITNANDDDAAETLDFNGEEGRDERNQIIYKINTSTSGRFLVLYGTGHRWYASGGDVPAGGNFNPAIAYLWSSHIVFNNGSAYGLALGGNDNTSNFHFVGRRAMARPIRPVKEFN